MSKLADMPPAQRAQCEAFLKELRRTANAKLSAERVGVKQQTMHARRRRFPVFATRWDAALAFARARLAKHGCVPPEGDSPKTQGGEYTVKKDRHGCLQIKRARAGHLTADGERLFLESLAATANVKLSCDVVGISDTSIYHRRRGNLHFADRMDAALEHGYDRLETEMLESAIASLDPSQLRDWMDKTVELPSPLLRMSFEQCCMLLGMHYKHVRWKQDRYAHNRKETRAEETDAAIMDLLARIKRRTEEKNARDERMAARGEESWEEATRKRLGIGTGSREGMPGAEPDASASAAAVTGPGLDPDRVAVDQSPSNRHPGLVRDMSPSDKEAPFHHPGLDPGSR